MRASIPSLAPLVFVFACGGSMSTEADSADASSSAPPASGLSTPSYTPASFTSAQVAAAKAACGAPHGPVYTPSTYAQYEAHFVGAWYLCSVSGPDAGAPDFPEAAVVFTADGQAQFLGDDGNGGLIAIPGLADQGTYSLLLLCQGMGVDSTYSCSVPEGFYLSVSVNATESTGEGHGLFEVSPARLEIQDSPYDDVPESGTYAFWYVPLAGD